MTSGKTRTLQIPVFEELVEPEKTRVLSASEPKAAEGLSKRRFEMMDAAFRKAKADTERTYVNIMAQEDQAMFAIMDKIASIPRCKDKTHTAYDHLLEECEEPECQVRQIQES